MPRHARDIVVEIVADYHHNIELSPVLSNRPGKPGRWEKGCNTPYHQALQKITASFHVVFYSFVTVVTLCNSSLIHFIEMALSVNYCRPDHIFVSNRSEFKYRKPVQSERSFILQGSSHEVSDWVFLDAQSELECNRIL
jgi:hypothetical protein